MRRRGRAAAFTREPGDRRAGPTCAPQPFAANGDRRARVPAGYAIAHAVPSLHDARLRPGRRRTRPTVPDLRYADRVAARRAARLRRMPAPQPEARRAGGRSTLVPVLQPVVLDHES